jgi:hypothetical protein
MLVTMHLGVLVVDVDERRRERERRLSQGEVYGGTGRGT